MGELALMSPAELQATFSFFGLERIDRQKPVWHSTGALLRKHKPEIYRLAVELLGAGRHSKREVCRLLHVSPHTLEAVESDQAVNLATLRQQAARENMELHRLSLERAGELLPVCADLAKVAIASGIFAEKSQLFAGEATARIAGGQPIDLVERFGAFVEALEKKVSGREIGLDEKKTAANSGLPALPAVPRSNLGQTAGDLPIIEADSSCIESKDLAAAQNPGVASEGLTQEPNR